MQSRIRVENRKEAAQIRAGLEDKAVRAFVKIVGTLNALPSDRARIRVLRFVQDSQSERLAGGVSSSSDPQK